MIDELVTVDVYRNLRRNCWSVRQRGRVVAHTKRICLRHAVCKVSQAGRLRVLRDRQKNVHAFIRGHIDTNAAVPDDDWIAITYDPYLYASFVNEQLESILAADYVVMDCTARHPVLIQQLNS